MYAAPASPPAKARTALGSVRTGATLGIPDSCRRLRGAPPSCARGSSHPERGRRLPSDSNPSSRLPHAAGGDSRAGSCARRAGKPDLVLRDAGVDFVAPGQNTALHVADVLEASLFQHAARLRAAHAAFAMNHDIGVLIELMQSLRHFAERNQLRGGDVADLVLVRLAHVDQHELVTAVEHGFDFREIGRAHVHLCLLSGRRVGAGHPAELMVIDQLGDGAVVAADGAVGILPQLQFAEAHAERIIEEQAADQGLADPEDQFHGLGGLNQTNGAGENSEHAAFSATWHEAWGWRFGIEAAVARAAFIGEYRRLTLEA